MAGHTVTLCYFKMGHKNSELRLSHKLNKRYRFLGAGAHALHRTFYSASTFQGANAMQFGQTDTPNKGVFDSLIGYV